MSGFLSFCLDMPFILIFRHKIQFAHLILWNEEELLLQVFEDLSLNIFPFIPTIFPSQLPSERKFRFYFITTKSGLCCKCQAFCLDSLNFETVTLSPQQQQQHTISVSCMSGTLWATICAYLALFGKPFHHKGKHIPVIQTMTHLISIPARYNTCRVEGSMVTTMAQPGG